jgi:Ca-activated chloride channel family protein
MGFEFHVAFLIFIIVPPFIYFVHFRKNRGGKVIFSFEEWKGKGFYPRMSARKVLYFVSYALLWLCFCFLILALAGPIKIERNKVYLQKGIDIMIVLDESLSMLAQDFTPKDRFTTAKRVINDFIRGRENDEIGLVSFSEEAVLRVPATIDYPLLLSTLDNLEVEALKDGTAIGMGISLASLHLQYSTAQEKVIILLTDGENNAGEIDPEKAAAVADELGIRIYTIGMGQEEAYMEYIDPETGKTVTGVYMEYRDPVSGELVRGVYSGKFDEILLRSIADISGAKYFHASNTGTLNQIFEQIDLLEETEKRVKINVKKVQLYREFVFIALLFFFASFLIRKLVLKEIL